MLIGRGGNFVLRAPFTKYGSSGINGKIVEVSYIQHMVSRGENAKEMVYTPVGGDGYYKADYNDNVIIVSIKSGNGTIYMIPDKYIENLYNNNLLYVDTFLTTYIGSLPKSFDYTQAKEVIARSITEAVGVEIQAKDVFVSADNGGNYVTEEENDFLSDLRDTFKTDNTSDYGKYNEKVEEVNVLRGKLDTMEKTVFDLIG